MWFFNRSALLLLTFISIYAQVGTWEKIATLTEVRDLLPQENLILLATDGGLLQLEKSSGSFSNGWNGKVTENLDLNTLFVDTDDLLWVGGRSPGPIVEVLDLGTREFLDVEYVDLDGTNSFVQVGDSVYATYQEGLEGGLLLYRKASGSIEYLDIFNNFPSENGLNMSYTGDAGFNDGKIHFRTNHEILWADLDGRNLKDPVNWEVSRFNITGDQITSMITLSDTILVSAGNQIYTYDYNTFTPLVSISDAILDLQKDPTLEDGLIVATERGVHALDLATMEIDLIQNHSHIRGLKTYDHEIWIASGPDFVALLDDDEYLTYSANRPLDHQFNEMVVDATGQLIGGGRSGFSILNENGWKTIKAGTSNSTFDESVYDWNELIIETLNFSGNATIEDMLIDQADNTYFSIQSRGVLRLDDRLPGHSRFYSADDGSMEPTFDSDTYVLPGQMAVDSKDNVYATTKFVREGGSVVSILTPQDSVYHIHQYQGGLSSRSAKSIAIDEHDRIWLGSQVRTELQASGGIHFIEVVGNQLSHDMELNVASLQMSGSPLASNEILQLEVDLNKILWILTSAGVQSMPIPDTWLNTAELTSHANLYMTQKEPDFYYYWQLTDYNVTGIEIDQRGNHWFLSDNAGVHVLQENGRWINGGFGYNTSNSGLLDNEIYALAFDGESGQTYFSTPKGISVLNTPFANPKETYSKLHIYPQPFNPDAHEKVIIQGLMDNSTVRILTVQGVVVRELNYLNNQVQGYEAQWDGRDESGDKVGSGVYLLFLHNDEGEAASYKIAVLR